MMDEPEGEQPLPEPTGRRNGSNALRHFRFLEDQESNTDWSIDVVERFTQAKEAGPQADDPAGE
jgi:hypothetical protein